MSKLLQSVLSSIAAAIVFWLIFAYFPERRRRNKLRPKLDLDICQVYRTLFTIFDLIMGFGVRSPSAFQSKIRANMLRPEDIELGLQNKCLNESFLYDRNVSGSLMPIGRELSARTKEIDEITDRLFQFSNYLTTREILLLEQVRVKLHVYDLERLSELAKININGRPFAPVNPCRLTELVQLGLLK